MRLDEPILAINFKAYYPYSFGKKALELARAAEEAARETGVIIIIIPPYTELRALSESTSLQVYAQHADPIEPGAHTGWIPLEAILDAGATGVLLNHSEHRLKLADLSHLVERAGGLGLQTLVCSDTPRTSAAAAALNPTMLAIEPPELIGTGIPVSRAKPEIITETLKQVEKINPDLTVLAGAGITSGEDAAAALRLGAKGVLVASAIVKAKNPYQKILEMASAMQPRQ
jgi:triosephosphate isomerase